MSLPTHLSRLFLDPLRALAFLSRIPVSRKVFAGQARNTTAQTVWAYPLAGLLIACPTCLVIWLAGSSAPMLAAVLAVITTTIITGALHEDGLADVADGFWGGHTIERRLEIMKDSAIGSYGTLALIGVFSLNVASLGTILQSGSSSAGISAALAAAAVSRGAMGAKWALTPSVRRGGVADTAGQPSLSMAIIALTLAGAVALLAGAWSAALVGLLAALGFTFLCKAKIGGHTGDTLGATQQITEAVMLAALAFAT